MILACRELISHQKHPADTLNQMGLHASPQRCFKRFEMQSLPALRKKPFVGLHVMYLNIY